MTQPEPIKQRIEAELERTGFNDAARAIKELGDAAEKSGDQAAKSVPKLQTREQQLAEQRQRLEQLIRSEVRYEDAMREGKAVTDRAVEASKRRRREIDKITRSLRDEDRIQQRVNNTVRQSSKAKSELSDAAKFALGGVSSLAAGFAGSYGLNAVVEEFNRHIEASNRLLRENAGLTRENADARLDLAALSGVEDAGSVAFLDRVAGFAGRRPGEIARVKTQIRSGLPTATDEQVNSLVVEIASKAQSTSAPLTSLAPVFLDIFRRTGDARVSSNLLEGAITAAGESDPAKLGQEISKFLGVGEQIGGLDTATSVGFASAGTGLGLPNELATTGLKNVAFSLRGRGTPEGNKVLDREAIPRDDLVAGISAIQQAVSAGRITNAELESIGGREAAPVFSALADEQTLNRFLDTVQIVIDAGESPGRLAEEKAVGITGSSPIQSLNLLAKQEESKTESVKSGDVLAARVSAARAIMERVIAERQAQGELNARQGERILDEFDRLTGLGTTGLLELPHAAHRASRHGASLGDLVFGPVADPRFREEVERGLFGGPDTSVDEVFGGEREPAPAGRTLINHGTIINQAGDPTEDDLVEGRPIN